MLRIKPEVNLKELEKFGFDEDLVNAIGKYVDNNDCEYNIIYVMKNDKTIRLGHYQDEYGATDTLNLDTLYDLITAGLVEKIEE